MTYCRYYCLYCDKPADEHREGSCRNCGRPVIALVENRIEEILIEKKAP